MLKIFGAVIGMALFAWSWSKMSQILAEWTDKKEK